MTKMKINMSEEKFFTVVVVLYLVMFLSGVFIGYHSSNYQDTEELIKVAEVQKEWICESKIQRGELIKCEYFNEFVYDCEDGYRIKEWYEKCQKIGGLESEIDKR
jgi:hypothetical protein